MSSVVPNRKSFGNKSNKSNKSWSSKRGPTVSSRFLKPTISSTLKKRELNMMKGDDENKSLTETVGKTSTLSKHKSPALSKFLSKSPLKPISKFINRRMSPAVKPKVMRIPSKKINKSVKENVVKSPPTKIPSQPKNSSRKLNYDPKPIEGIDFKFEIPSILAKPSILTKKRDIKEAEKTDQESVKGIQFADITNQNFDAISTATPLRCITGKSSVVRSSNISLLQSINGSGKSTPNITPYKMMRRNKENDKNGDQGIDSLEEKIKQLERQIYDSKLIKPDDEESDQNEFLDGISQIDVKEIIESNIKKSAKTIEPEEQIKPKATIPEEIKLIKPKTDNEDSENGENNEIKELEDILGQVYSTINLDEKLSRKLQDQAKKCESITTGLLNSVKNDDDMEPPELRNSSAKSNRKLATKKTKQIRRRRSNRNKKTYDHIDLLKKTHRRNDEWFKDNEVWTRSRKKRKFRETEY
jgi:hypothetical protein